MEEWFLIKVKLTEIGAFKHGFSKLLTDNYDSFLLLTTV